MRTTFTISLVLFGALTTTHAVYADGPFPVGEEQGQEASGGPRSPRLRETPTSKQFDPRLPPVLPGETIVTESGDKMKVWSSSGPVPVNPPPTNSNGNLGDVDVLLDGRFIDRRDPSPGRPPLRPR